MIIVLGAIGLIVGSFLNAWIRRTREGNSIISGRSQCPTCRRMLLWYENIPLVSFVVQKGMCRGCKEPISWQYPLVEIAVGVLFAFVAWAHAGDTLMTIRDAYILFFLTFVFVYDLQYQEIWDRMTIYPASLLAAASVWFGWISIPSMLIGAVVGMGFFFVQYVVSKGRWIGGGDIRLGLFMGIILGWPLIVLALFLAYVGGSLFVMPFLLLGKKQFASKIPFGTYLSVATFVAMFWGEKILDWYIRLLV